MGSVLHLTHTWGGGTQKYIDDMRILFPQENHVVVNSYPFRLDFDKVKVVHIHSTMVGANIGWEVLNLVRALKTNNKKIVLSVHDYQWLFPNCPNPTTEEFETLRKQEENVRNFKELVSLCDVIFMHTRNVLKRYEQFCGPIDLKKITLTHPCDVKVHYDNFFIPEIKDDKIKVGFLGGKSPHKGFYQFMDLALKFKMFEFHVYGGEINSSSLVVSHGKYDDDKITDELKKEGIHILLALSLSEETYCYALTKMINTGIPIVYFNRGSFSERLLNVHNERFFPVDSLCDLGNVFLNAVEYVKNNSPRRSLLENDCNVLQMNENYKNIYSV